MSEIDSFELMQSWGLKGGWPGMSREDMRSLLKDAEPSGPALEEIVQWEPHKVAGRLFQDVFDRLKLTIAERQRIGRLRSESDFRRISDEEIELLVTLLLKHGGPIYLFQLIARFWEDRYVYKQDLWYLPRAASCWRRARQPDLAISCLEKAAAAKDEALLAAVFTSWAGALCDLGELETAEKRARSALGLNPSAPHPYNVLGTITYRRGDFDSGDYYFSEAEARGSTDSGVSEARAVLESMLPEDRQVFVTKLLNVNPRRHRWAQKYLPPFTLS